LFQAAHSLNHWSHLLHLLGLHHLLFLLRGSCFSFLLLPSNLFDLFLTANNSGRNAGEKTKKAFTLCRNETSR
jgi:hypothetical protein